MKLVTLSKPIIKKKQEDIHGETHIIGFCEYCWAYDRTINLSVFHDAGTDRSHVLAHKSCAPPDWGECQC